MAFVDVDEVTGWGWISPEPVKPPDVLGAIDAAPPPADYISDNLGHHWDSAIQDWRNDNDNSRYNYGPVDPGNSNPAAWTAPATWTTPAQSFEGRAIRTTSPDEAPVSGDYNLGFPRTALDNYASDVRPAVSGFDNFGTEMPAQFRRPVQPPAGSGTYGGPMPDFGLRPENANYPDTTPIEDRLGSGESNLGLLGRAAGDVYRRLTTSVLPKSFTEDLPDQWYFPVRQTVEGVYSPLGLATLPFGGSNAATSALRNVGAIMGGSMAGGAADEYLPEDMPGRGLAVAGAGLAGGVAGYGAAGKLASKGAGVIAKGAEAVSGEGALASERGSVALPDRFSIRPGEAEVGMRTGNLLKPRGAEQLGEGYQPKAVLDVANDLNRQVNSQANVLRAEAENASKALGPRVTGSDRNVYLRDIAASPAERALGQTRALAVRVMERPQEYALTPEQSAAVAKLVAIPEAVKNERGLFGVAPNEIGLDEGQNYFHRVATNPAIERTDNVVQELVNGAKPRKGILDYGESGGGSSRLAIGKDKGRLIDDPIDFVKRGGVYADPLVALDQNVTSGLSKAANAHVKNLLEPFIQTAADRVSPGMRAQVDGLRQSISSLKATGARLTGKQQGIIDDFVAGKTNDLDQLRDALDGVKVGPNAVGKIGPNYGKGIGDLQSTLADAKQRLQDILPDWRQEVERSKNVPADRAAVNSRLAPALIGSDFEKDVAKQIEKFYGRTMANDVTQSGMALAKARAINTALIPVKATMDLSALLNQQGRMVIMHPVDYVKNLGLSLRDIVSSEAYNTLMSSDKAKAAASRGLVLLGESGQKGEFQFSNWFEHIPGVGKIAQGANKQFTAFNNRMRLAAFDDWTSAAKAAGNPLDAAGEEQLARGLNRMTGISNSRAGDLEQLAFFAPNFLRSHFENIGKALTDGGIEGQVARRYLGTTFAAGTALVSGAAMAQGRDPSEVLSPFDLKALKQGTLRWNGNFGTIRVAGQDVSVYGPYTSLARLAGVAASGALDSINERDARPFLVQLMNIPSTKGSPVLKFGIDTVKGQTFEGNSPTDLSPRGMINAALDMALPISLATIINDKRRDLSWHDTILDTIANAIGANSNPVTAFEKRDQEAQDRFGKTWGELSPVEQNALKAVPGSAAADYQSTNPVAIASKVVDARLREQNVATQQKIDAKYAVPGKTYPAGPQAGQNWRDEYHTAQWGIQQQFKTKDLAMPFTGAPSEEPMRLAVNEWSKTIDANVNGTKTNWDAVDAWMAANPDKAALVNQYMNDPNKPPSSALTPMVQQYKNDSGQLANAGYFDLRDNTWQKLSKNNPALRAYASFDDYVTAKQESYAAKLPKSLPESRRQTLVDVQMANDPIASIYSQLKSTATQAWVMKNPKLASLAVRWGYLEPTKLEKAIIAARGD